MVRKCGRVVFRDNRRGSPGRANKAMQRTALRAAADRRAVSWAQKNEREDTMENITMAALGIAVATWMIVRSLRLQVHALSARLKDLEDELHASVMGDAS